ncbi:MAG: hypothetical protein OER43_08190 [Gammaproteobacteria bacterium]|nr:hypothetical protein [Gammaproteobacteria bacterium]MDH3411266.1 hypothetical protein [Gammaproteobacteria bacterium]
MVKNIELSLVFKSLVRCCLGIVIAVVCGLTDASAQDPAAGLRLKLDWDLMPRIGTPGVSRAQMLAAEAPELRGRILKVRDQVAELGQSNAEKSAYLTRHEELIQRMNGVLAAQEKVIARLAAEAQLPKPRAMVQAPVTAPRPAPLPRPQATTAVAPIRFGPLELPGVVRNYLLESALGGIAVVLFGWVLYLRAVAKSRTAELVMLKSGARTATPTPTAEVEPEAFEPEPPPAKAKARPVKKPAPARPAAAVPPSRQSDSDTAPELDWSDTVVRQKASDPDALADVDTLIAKGDAAKARQLLVEMMKGHEDNPEYRLRLLHVDSSLGDSSKAAEQEKILAKMKDGPLSGTLDRIKEIGRGLMPGHPLFDNSEKLEQAKQIISGREPVRPTPAESNPLEEDKARKPVAAPGRRPQAPPLILDLEADDGTIDFLTEVNFDMEDENDNKG